MAEILRAVSIGATRERVFDALTRTQSLESWWAPRCVGDCLAGRELRFTFDAAHVGEVRVLVETIEDLQRVEWVVIDGPARLRGTRVAFTLEEAPRSSTRLRVAHSGFSDHDEELDQTSWKWALYLARLRMVCEAGERGGGAAMLPYGEVGIL